MKISQGADMAAAAEAIKSWPAVSREAAIKLMDRYGPPDETTPTRLTWFENKPWRRTVLHRDPVPHDFPAPHDDVLEQVVAYRVPTNKVGEIVAFYGSLLVDRTKGEIAARCGTEAGNILALNLAHEIVQGKRDVAGARRVYVETFAAEKAGYAPALMQRLAFELHADTGDPDKAVN